MKNQTIGINGMNCMNCVGKIEKGVGALDGVLNLSIDLKGKSMTLDLDEGATPLSKVHETIGSLGFEVFEHKPKGFFGKIFKK
ncbi:MAG: heavy-metal-associated domain-containing protein [Turicibacter sp.]|nr:heavy-metal-associated domain-containing protein [Turicibacter sp.]